MKKLQSWEVSDTLWERVAPLVPSKMRDSSKKYTRKSGAGRKSIDPKTVFAGIDTLSIYVTGANRHDSPCLEELLLRGILPEVAHGRKENLCLDTGYFGIPSENLCKDYGYTAHIHSRGEERKAKSEGNPEPNRRWVVERTNSWFNRFRKLLIRYEKRPQVMRPYWSLLAELLHTGDYLLFMDKLLVVLIIFYFKNI